MANHPTTEPIDWRSILVRYVKTVMEDDIVVGCRCLTDPAWSPEWTKEERDALRAVRKEAWPELSQWTEDESNGD